MDAGYGGRCGRTWVEAGGWGGGGQKAGQFLEEAGVWVGRGKKVEVAAAAEFIGNFRHCVPFFHVSIGLPIVKS